MCGFVASAGLPDDPARQTALNLLQHRGPDAAGSWSHPQHQIWLGHRRLAIVDLSADGNQPMTNENGQLHLVCNGEIYNAPALRRQLQAMGHHFSSRSDNEVILHAYEAWGEACVDRLHGMFAFALWRQQEQTLWLVRDPMGMKPLYYAELPGAIVAASEVAAIRALLPAIHRPDPLALGYLLTLGYIPAPHALWQGVQKLPAGHALRWRDGASCLVRHWQPPTRPGSAAPLSREDWQSLFSDILDDHLMADLPIALFLSAGLDSSALAVGLAMKGLSLQAYTVAFADSPRDEAPMARALAQSLGFPHQSVPLTAADMGPLLREAGRLDEPVTTSGMPLYLAICRQAARHGKVVLGGDGGDEAMGGYTWYRNLSPLPRGGHGLLRKAWAPLLRRPVPPLVRRLAARGFAASSVLHRHAWRIFPRFLPEEVAHLLSPMQVRFDEEAMLAPLARHFEPGLALPRALQRVDLLTYCSDYNNTKVDRASMAHGLEVRLPFLDRRLVESHLQLPWESAEERESKPRVREFIRGRVPQALLQRPKQGFSLRSEPPDWQAMLATIENGYWVRQGLWHRDWKNMVLPGVPYREGRIWTLAMLTCWGEAWLK